MPMRLSKPFNRKRKDSSTSQKQEDAEPALRRSVDILNRSLFAPRKDLSTSNSSGGDKIGENWDTLGSDLEIGNTSGSHPTRHQDVPSTPQYQENSGTVGRHRRGSSSNLLSSQGQNNVLHSSPLAKDSVDAESTKSKFSLKALMRGKVNRSPQKNSKEPSIRPSISQSALTEHMTNQNLSKISSSTSSQGNLSPESHAQHRYRNPSVTDNNSPLIRPLSIEGSFSDLNVPLPDNPTPNESDTVSVSKFRRAMAMRSSVSLHSEHNQSTPKLDLPISSLAASQNASRYTSEGPSNPPKHRSSIASYTSGLTQPNPSQQVVSPGSSPPSHAVKAPRDYFGDAAPTPPPKSVSPPNVPQKPTHSAIQTSLSALSLDEDSSVHKRLSNLISGSNPPSPPSNTPVTAGGQISNRSSQRFSPKSVSLHGWKTADTSDSDSDNGAGDDESKTRRTSSNDPVEASGNTSVISNAHKVSRTTSPTARAGSQANQPGKSSDKMEELDQKIVTQYLRSGSPGPNQMHGDTFSSDEDGDEDNTPLARLSMQSAGSRHKRSSSASTELDQSKKAVLLGMNVRNATSTLALPSQEKASSSVRVESPDSSDDNSSLGSTPQKVPFSHTPVNSLSSDLSAAGRSVHSRSRASSYGSGNIPTTASAPPDEPIILERRHLSRSNPMQSNHRPSPSLLDLAEEEKRRDSQMSTLLDSNSRTDQPGHTKDNSNSWPSVSGGIEGAKEKPEKHGYDFGASVLRRSHVPGQWKPVTSSAGTSPPGSGNSSPRRSGTSSYFSTLQSPVSQSLTPSQIPTSKESSPQTSENKTPSRSRVSSFQSKNGSTLSENETRERMKGRHRREMKDVSRMSQAFNPNQLSHLSHTSESSGISGMQPYSQPMMNAPFGNMQIPPGVDPNLFMMLPPDQKFQLQQRGMMLMSMMAQAANQAAQVSGSVVGGSPGSGGSAISGFAPPPPMHRGMMAGNSIVNGFGGNEATESIASGNVDHSRRMSTGPAASMNWGRNMPPMFSGVPSPYGGYPPGFPAMASPSTMLPTAGPRSTVGMSVSAGPSPSQLDNRYRNSGNVNMSSNDESSRQLLPSFSISPASNLETSSPMNGQGKPS